MSFGKWIGLLGKALVSVCVAAAVSVAFCDTYYDVLSQAEKTIDLKYPAPSIANTAAKQDLMEIHKSSASEAEKIRLIQKKFLGGDAARDQGDYARERRRGVAGAHASAVAGAFHRHRLHGRQPGEDHPE
jgi:hypothetical protein